MITATAVSWAEELALREREVAGKDAASFKCEDCGKIIAAPADRPAPVCCDEPMKRIR